MTIYVPNGQWRDASAYAAILARGRSALAWEVLRRDPDYQRQVIPISPGPQVVEAAPEVAARWGLLFPGRPGLGPWPGHAVLVGNH